MPEAKEQSWRLEARGQIEGIGTSPRLCAKGADGRVLVENTLPDVRDGRTALDAVAAWLRSNYGGERVLGIGHRVVHGGMRYARPVVVNRQVLSDLYELAPLAPLHQPHNLAAIEAVCQRLPGVTSCVFRHKFSSRAYAGGAGRAITTGDLQVRADQIWLSWSFLRVCRLYFAHDGSGDRQASRHRRAPRERCQFVRDQWGKERRHDDELHGTGWTVHGYETRDY